jgi:hypothetical protein
MSYILVSDERRYGSISGFHLYSIIRSIYRITGINEDFMRVAKMLAGAKWRADRVENSGGGG